MGLLQANRAAGGRVLRAELHGVGVSCFMKLNDDLEILQDGAAARGLVPVPVLLLLVLVLVLLLLLPLRLLLLLLGCPCSYSFSFFCLCLCC